MNLTHENQLKQYVQNIKDENDANIFLFSASITDANADRLIDIIKNISPKRKNAALFMTTYGGDPDAAFRIARYLKRQYEKFILFVFGYCKSAGTLLALGADEIVMSDYGELGPLDIQVSKDDDFRQSSGLDLQQALSVISSQAFEMFAYSFSEIISRSQANITTKTAADIASAIAVGLLSPISSQIDPMRLGEMNRLMDIALAYGERLNPQQIHTVNQLISGYPSHSFVIDYTEAADLFNCLREPTESEYALEQLMFSCLRLPQDIITSLDEVGMTDHENTIDENQDENESETTNERNSEESTQTNSGEIEESEQNSILYHKSE